MAHQWNKMGQRCEIFKSFDCQMGWSQGRQHVTFQCEVTVGFVGLIMGDPYLL